MPKADRFETHVTRNYDGIVAMVAMRILGVTGEMQAADDLVLVGSYEEDREACEDAISAAQAELDHAGDAYDQAWAWHKLDEAYVRLAHVIAREALARRRAGS